MRVSLGWGWGRKPRHRKRQVSFKATQHEAGQPSLIPKLAEEDWKLWAPSAPLSEFWLPASAMRPRVGVGGVGRCLSSTFTCFCNRATL